MITIKTNGLKFGRQLQRYQKAREWDTREALTKTAYDVAFKDLPRNMRRVFKQATRFTLRAFKYTRARRNGKGDWFSSVDYKYVSGLRRHYLETMVFGGKRVSKGFELLLHRKAKAFDAAFPKYFIPSAQVAKDKSGNVARRIYNQVLSDLGAQREQGSKSNATATSRRRNRKRARFFFGSPKHNNLPFGVWQRKGKDIEPVFFATNDAGSYSKTLRLFEIERRAVLRRFPIHLGRAERKTARRHGLRMIS